MDWATVGTAVLAGAAGAFGKSAYSRLSAVMKGPNPSRPPAHKIWPNGDREEIVLKIDRLSAQYRSLTNQVTELQLSVQDLANQFERYLKTRE